MGRKNGLAVAKQRGYVNFSLKPLSQKAFFHPFSKKNIIFSQQLPKTGKHEYIDCIN
jgi:hypothetical protein